MPRDQAPLIHRSLGPLALAALLACGTPESASTPEPRGGRETDDAAEWAAARRTDDAPIADDDPLADGAPLDDDLPADQAEGGDRFPCTIAGQQEIEELLGNTVEAPAWTLEEVDDGGVTYAAETCGWLSFAADANEIILQVSRAEHFADGRVRCWTAAADSPADDTPGGDVLDQEGAGADDDATAEIDEDIEPEPAPVAVADLGSAAWWIHDPPTAFGQLQVCHPNGRIAVEVNYGDGARARRAAVELARRVIGGLVDGG